jgi:hypothetical protein
LAAIVRHHGSDSSYAQEARRDLRFAQIRAKVVEAVNAAPPLTLDQIRELSTLLRGGE